MPKGKHCKPSGRECRIRDLKANLVLKQMAIEEMQKAIANYAEEINALRNSNRDLKLLLEFYKSQERSGTDV